MLQCHDNFSKNFNSFENILIFHAEQNNSSKWVRTEVKNLRVAPLDGTSTLYVHRSGFAPKVSNEAIEDTASNLGLALKVGEHFYPLRDTAFKSLLDRAKIGGTALPKLSKNNLASVLNKCLCLHSSEALVLIRDEKVSATHSGDAKDYSVLAIDELLDCIHKKLSERFPGHRFETGYADHCLTSASWSMPLQSDDLLGTYKKVLDAQGKSAISAKLRPGVRFCSSDVGLASAKVAAMILGLSHPIHIGGMLAVDHRSQAKVEDFNKNLDLMFAQFVDAVAKLEKLATIYLDHPINAMTAICKKLSMPKKAALEAIAMFECTLGSDAATAHDVFMALQEIIFILRTEGTPEGKLLVIEENLARALSLKWQDYDLAKAVSY